MKRQRSDHAERKKRQKAARQATVMTGWTRALKRARNHPSYNPEWEQEQTWTEKLEALVTQASDAVVLASWLLHAFIVYNAHHDALDIEINQSLCRTAISLVANTGRTLATKAVKQEALKAFYADHFLPTLPAGHVPPQLKSMGNIGAALAREMEQNFNLSMAAVDRRVIRFLKKRYGLSARSANAAWNRNWNTLGAIDPAQLIDIQQQVDVFRDMMDTSSLLFQVHLLDACEEVDAKTFSLFPIRSMRKHCVVLDTELLQQWCQPGPLLPLEAFFPKRRGKEPGTPGAQIVTDGVRTYYRFEIASQVNAPSLRKTKRSKPTQLPTKGFVRLEHVETPLDDPGPWEAFDPGYRSLYTGSEGTQLKRSKWESLLGTKWNAQRLEAKKRSRPDIIEAELALSNHSLQTADIDTLYRSLSMYARHYRKIMDFYGSRNERRNTFRLKQRRQKALAYVVNGVLGKELDSRNSPKRERSVTAFGNALWSPSRKGSPPTPVTLIRETIARHACVLLVDEFRTSRACSACGALMQLDPENATLFHCQQCQKSWDRDHNASLNIALCVVHHLAGKPRPFHLTRPTL